MPGRETIVGSKTTFRTLFQSGFFWGSDPGPKPWAILFWPLRGSRRPFAVLHIRRLALRPFTLVMFGQGS